MFQWIKDSFILGIDGTDNLILCLSPPSSSFYLLQKTKMPTFPSSSGWEVVEVGSSVNRLKVGDQVVSHAYGIQQNFNDPAKSAFQLGRYILSSWIT